MPYRYRLAAADRMMAIDDNYTNMTTTRMLYPDGKWQLLLQISDSVGFSNANAMG